jgi:hypothetical protein
MARTIRLSSRLWPVGQTVQEIDGLQPNTDGFDLRFQFVAGSMPAGAVISLEVQFSHDGVQFNRWVGPVELAGDGLGRDGLPRTSFGVSGTWPIEDDGTGTKTNRVLRAASIRAILDVLQPFTASLDVVTT